MVLLPAAGLASAHGIRLRQQHRKCRAHPIRKLTTRVTVFGEYVT